MQGYLNRLVLVEQDAEGFKAREATYVTRVEFTPVQRVVYGLVAFVMGGFVMAVLGMVFKVVVPK